MIHASIDLPLHDLSALKFFVLFHVMVFSHFEPLLNRVQLLLGLDRIFLDHSECQVFGIRFFLLHISSLIANVLLVDRSLQARWSLPLALRLVRDQRESSLLRREWQRSLQAVQVRHPRCVVLRFVSTVDLHLH